MNITYFTKALLILFLVHTNVFGQTSPVQITQEILLDGNSKGKRFDGIGIVNGGGGTSVLLKDYPSQQRDEIMDMVFKPMFGASVSSLLVEIPGDGNSTQGSMPSHSHYRGDYNYSRGYTWWVLKEAKVRNPKLTLDCAAWSAPGWIGNGNFWSQDGADYYVSWLRGLREKYGLEMDAIGCRNEKGESGDFAKMLRKSMDNNGFSNVKLHGFDNWGKTKLDFLDYMLNDSSLCNAIDIISAHTFNEIGVSLKQKEQLSKLGKPLWNSEDHVYLKGFNCLISIVSCFNKNYIDSGVTKIINWYDIAGVYPMEPYSHDPAMILAWEPWSGYYKVRQNLWGYAHYGQFSEAGWEYMDSGCTHLDKGGTIVTLRNPKNGDYSMIIETKGAKEAQTLQVKLTNGMKESPLCIWKSNESEQFVRKEDLKPRRHSIIISLEPNTVYSISTMSGQQKGEFVSVPQSSPFPIPYKDDFEGYGNLEEWGYLPHYTADIIGSFELTERPTGDGTCLRQVVGHHTNSWAPEWHYYTIIGDSAWRDYEVSADVYLNPGDEAGVMGRICHVGWGYGIEAEGYYLKINDMGICRLVITRGKEDKNTLVGDAEQQALILSNHDDRKGGERLLSESKIEGFSALNWHKLTLRMDGNRIIGLVDGQEVLSSRSDQYPHGMAGLIAPFRSGGISTPYFDNLEIKPLGRTVHVDARDVNINPLY